MSLIRRLRLGSSRKVRIFAFETKIMRTAAHSEPSSYSAKRGLHVFVLLNCDRRAVAALTIFDKRQLDVAGIL